MLLLTFYLSLIALKLTALNDKENSLSNYTSIRISDDKQSFWAAKTICLKNFDSYLAMVTNKNDTAKLGEMLRKRNISSAWIGLTDFGREKQFYWTNDHSDNVAVMWDETFPRDDRNASDCVLISRNDQDMYKWIDTHCASKHPFICMKVNKTDVIKPDLLPPHEHYINQCPRPFSPVDGDCFLMSSELLTWSDARLFCQSKSPESDLATIRTNFQQEYFAALISGSSTGFWIGLNYYDSSYQWILQQDIKFTRWGEQQPKDAIKKNCTFIGNNEHNLGNWYTASCSDKFNAICQTLKKNNDTSSISNSNTLDLAYDNFLFKKDECQKSGYYYYHDSCYRLYHDKQLSHNNAIIFCNQETFKNKSSYNFLVDLISLPSAGEKNLILADLRKSSSDSQSTTVWLNIRGNETGDEKSQLSQSSMVNSMTKIKHLCFKLLSNGVVNSSDCDDNSKGSPLCKYQLKNFNIKSLNSNQLTASCPSNWTLFNSFCYFFDNQTYQSRFEAKKSCIKVSANLISIDMYLQKFLTDFLKKFQYSSKSSNVWIGLEAKNSSDGRLQFNWSNESPVNYFNLESINVTSKRDKWCSVFLANSGLWRLTNCTKIEAMVVCQQPAHITSIYDRNRTTTDKKPFKYPKAGYYLKHDLLSWKEASEKCKAIKTKRGFVSTIATINSYSELLEIQSKKKNRKNQYLFWIGLSGLYDHFDNVFLHWADESNVIFQNYDFKNLMTLTGSENCVMMNLATGKWLASDCNIERPYVCRVMDNTTNENSQKESPLHRFLSNRRHSPGTRYCPDGFQEYFEKCYRVIDNQQMDWEMADKYCQELVHAESQVEMSLASIENRFENSFVYSLLSAGMYSTNDSRYWIGERYPPAAETVRLCAGMSSHPDPYIGARWFAENCSKKMKFICSSLKIQNTEPVSTGSLCRKYYVEYNNSMGTHCYFNEDLPNTWTDAKHFCDLRKTGEMLTLPSHYHLHFLMSQSEKYGWSRDNPVWLGAVIRQNDKFNHWQWNNGEDIRYTFWNQIPNLNDSSNGTLCLYLLPEKDKNGRFGVQIKECDKLIFRGYIVCEYVIKNPAQTRKKTVNKNCLANSRGDTYEGEMNNTVNGLRCVRWDLLKKPKEIIEPLRKDLDKHTYIQYHSNECRYISGMERSTTFCAYSSDLRNDSLMLQECTIGLCSHKILHHREENILKEHNSNVMTVVIVTLLLLICVIASIALLSWRRWNKSSLFGGYLRRGQFSMLNNQSRGTSFNNPIYSPINC